MEVFHHIRYATAGRFEPPVVSSCTEPENYSGQLTAFPQEQFRLNKVMGEGQPLCQSENAHYLSIYTPSRNGKFPVLFWIHGGAFIAGSGEDDTYDASALSEEGNIVVVTISYRLGILGYTYDETLPCQQMGTKDQIAALHWVHKNIHLYGGDASRVTIAGQSAGGFSVVAMLQTVKEPLFRRAIIQSAPLSITISKKEARRVACKVKDILGKPLTEATTEEILKAQTYFLSHNGSMMPFGPILSELSKPIQTPGVERVLFTWQKDDLSPFVELTLGGDTPLKRAFNRRIATFISYFSLYLPYNSFARHLRHQGVQTEIKRLDWRPKGSHYGACHCLELALLFGNWNRWKNVGMLGDTTQEEWQKLGRQLRAEWIDFMVS